MRPSLLLPELLLVSVVLVGCASGPPATPPGESVPGSPAATQSDPGAGGEAPTQPDASPSSIAWIGTPLTDAVTGKEFSITDFKGKPVLLHAFAVW